MKHSYKKNLSFTALLLISCATIGMQRRESPEKLLSLIQKSSGVFHFSEKQLSTKNSSGETVFHLACKKGDTETIKKLFSGKNTQQTQELLFSRDGSVHLGIHKAAANGKIATIKLLLNIHETSSTPADYPKLLFGGYVCNGTPLHHAVTAGKIEAVKILINHAEKYQILKKYLFFEKLGYFTAFHEAAYTNKAKIAALLLHAANDDARELASYYNNEYKPGVTPIHTALKKNNKDVLKICIKKLGPNILSIENKENPFLSDFPDDPHGVYQKVYSLEHAGIISNYFALVDKIEQINND